MSRAFAINGKYLRAAPTGVHRVANELCNALAILIAEGHPAARDLTPLLFAPVDGAERAHTIALPHRILGGPTGNFWEQVTLPLRTRSLLLLSLCNIGPVARRNAVTMIHDAQVHLTPESYRPAFRWWYRAVQPAFARRHRRVLTVSHYSRQAIADAGLCAIGNITVVPNGVDHMLRVEPDDRIVTALALPPARPRYVLGFATTQAHKNMQRILAAMADPTLGDLTLVLVGGDDRAAFERAGHRVPDNVRFAGRVSDGELRALMEGALCLVFPSTTEGFGLPPLEAMMVGCPAIVAPCGALPEMCGAAARYAAADSTAEWVAAIRALADDPEGRARSIAIGREHAAQYTWRASALSLIAAIEAFLPRQ